MSFPLAIDTAVIASLFGGAPFTSYSTHYIALFTSNPTETGTAGTEVSASGTGYARQSVTFTLSGRAAANTGAVEWPTATSSWGTLTHFGIYTAATGGVLLAYGEMQTPKTIAQGDTFRVPVSELTVTLD